MLEEGTQYTSMTNHQHRLPYVRCGQFRHRRNDSLLEDVHAFPCIPIRKNGRDCWVRFHPRKQLTQRSLTFRGGCVLENAKMLFPKLLQWNDIVGMPDLFSYNGGRPVI